MDRIGNSIVYSQGERGGMIMEALIAVLLGFNALCLVAIGQKMCEIKDVLEEEVIPEEEDMRIYEKAAA